MSAARWKRWRERNPEAYEASRRASRERNLERRAASAKAWREKNPEKVEARNAARRRQPSERTCVECGESFVAVRVDRVICSRKCKDRRHRRLHAETYAAKKRAYRERRRAAGSVPGAAC
jgi:hypothetical protein